MSWVLVACLSGAWIYAACRLAYWQGREAEWHARADERARIIDRLYDERRERL